MILVPLWDQLPPQRPPQIDPDPQRTQKKLYHGAHFFWSGKKWSLLPVREELGDLPVGMCGLVGTDFVD